MVRSQLLLSKSPNYHNPSSISSPSFADSVSHGDNHHGTTTNSLPHQTNDDSNGSNQNGKSFRSSVWKYATKITAELARCNRCGKEIKTSGGGTSSLRKHLVSQHQVTESLCKKVNGRTRNNLISKQKKDRLDYLLKLAIFEDGRCFGDFSKNGMVKFLDEAVPGYRPPHRNQVQQALKRLYSTHMIRLKQTLANVDSLALTTDFWSDRRNRSYLCITGHFIDNDMIMHSTVVNFQTFDDRHDARTIASVFKARLSDLSIENKIISVTSDGASNVRNVFDKFYRVKRLWCVAHRLHLTICNGLGFWKKFRKNEINEKNDEDSMVQSMLFDVTETQETPDDTMEIDQDSENESDEDDDENNESIRDSWDEQVQTADDSRSEDEENDDEPSEITKMQLAQLIHKCRLMTKIINRSQILSSFVNCEREKLGVFRRLSLDCPTRWNSTFFFLESLIRNKQVLLNLFAFKRQLSISVKQKEELATCELTSDEWIIVSHLLQILKPFYEATRLLSGSRYPSIGICLFAIRTIKDYLEIQTNDELPIIIALKNFLHRSLNYYFDENDDQYSLLRMHGYFDPLGYSVMTSSEKSKIERDLKQNIKNSTNGGAPNGRNGSHVSTMNDVSEELTSQSKRTEKSTTSLDKFLTSVDRSLQTNKSRSATISEEIATYGMLIRKHATTNAIHFWKQYGDQMPILKQQARYYLSTPGSSVPAESAFSRSAYIARKERSRLSPSNLCYTVFLKDKLTLPIH